MTRASGAAGGGALSPAVPARDPGGMDARDLAIVTGSSRGIGRAVTDALLARGFEVLGVARSRPLPWPSGHYAHFTCDLADVGAVRRVFEREITAAVSFDGRRRVGLVDNAGRLDLEPVVAAKLESLSASFMVNCLVPIFLHGWLPRAAPPHARLRIVDPTIGAATSPYPGWVAYCASKAALDMAGQVLATELAELPALQGRDVAVVSYAPHIVATSMQERIRAVDAASFPRKERFVKLHEAGELVDPAGPAAEIAELLLRDDLPPFSRRRFEPAQRP